MLGDAYGAAVVEALSKKELESMDEERAKQLEDDLESAQTDLKGKKVSWILCILAEKIPNRNGCKNIINTIISCLIG